MKYNFNIMQMEEEFKQLIAWSRVGFNHLPWRLGRTPYSTLVSELMLQQTTVATVIKHYPNFLKKYPTIHALAGASAEEILIAWKGLGYYRRARLLHQAAKDFVKHFAGNIPEEFEELVAIAGIGDYTASALRSIGHNLPALAIDANVARVLSRYQSGVLNPTINRKLRETLQNFYHHSLAVLSPRALNESLMDLGRTLCTANKKLCTECPLGKNCRAKPLANDFPARKPSQVKYNLHLIRVLVMRGKEILTVKRCKGQWLEGQRELPSFVVLSEDKKLKQYPKWPGRNDYKKWESFPTTITKYKIKNFIFRCTWKEYQHLFAKSAPEFEWVDLMAESSNLSTASLKVARTHARHHEEDVGADCWGGCATDTYIRD
ncbi:MAG: A/G-specific adenine glycosylase [Bdellovibrio sp.]|nr:A/G-specific adenine glycosylase [Bdellovibrio sp.]